MTTMYDEIGSEAFEQLVSHFYAFAQHFSWFGSSDYWAGQTHLLVEQCEAMQEEPLNV